jgi:hypothetical protein
MPGGGQLALVAVGAQNNALNGNPEKTWFYQSIRRHTHFSVENIGILMDGPNELMPDSQIRLRAKIPRHADLLTGLTLVFQLPAIYSSIWSLPTTNRPPQQRIPSFRWIHQIGANIIASLSVFISGTKVQEFPGEWIAARATMDYTAEQYQKWRNLVGDVPELTEPEWGVYGKSPNYPYAVGEYPHSIYDPSGAAAGTVPAPSIPAREIRVPLPLWFTDSWGTALPLVALQLHEVEIQITLRSLHELYRINEPVFNTEPARPGQQLVPNPAWPFTNEPTAIPITYDNLTLQNAWASWNDPIGELGNFLQPPTAYPMRTPATIGSAFNLNASLEGNYVYLTEKEQAMFAERALQIMVHQVQVFTYPSVVSKTRLDLDVHGPVTRLMFFGRRSDAIISRNDYVNLSNWKSLTQAPYLPPKSPSVPIPNSGQLINYYSFRDCIQSARLLVAGNELYEEKDAPFFELSTPFANAAGMAGPSLAVKPDNQMAPLYLFPFALNTSDHVAPSGTVNMSRIREVQLEVTPVQLDPNGFYVFDVTAYAESINILKLQNGMGGLAFAV